MCSRARDDCHVVLATELALDIMILSQAPRNRCCVNELPPTVSYYSYEFYGSGMRDPKNYRDQSHDEPTSAFYRSDDFH